MCREKLRLKIAQQSRETEREMKGGGGRWQLKFGVGEPIALVLVCGCLVDQFTEN